MKVEFPLLIIGANGGLSHITAKFLKNMYPKQKIFGIDSREDHSRHPYFDQFDVIHYGRGSFAEYFRINKFKTLLIVGRIHHAKHDPYTKMMDALELPIVSVQDILNLCLQYEVQRVVILGSHQVYGADPNQPTFIPEEWPAQESENPVVKKIVQVDINAQQWIWKHQSSLTTTLLRPCHIVGPLLSNAMTNYLKSKHPIRPIDYNPVIQIIDQEDMARILIQSISDVPGGVFNVAPKETIRLQKVLDLIPAKKIPISMFLIEKFRTVLRKYATGIPEYMINHLKYSCILDSSRLYRYISPKSIRFSPEDTVLRLLQKDYIDHLSR